MLKRKEVLEFFVRLEPGLIGLEACASAHHWARQLTTLEHEVRLVPPQYVKAYLRGNKNDYNDANDVLAISEAVTRPQMRFAAIKTAEQQDLQALHRLRECSVKMRTGLCNQIRALVCAKGISHPAAADPPVAGGW